MVTIEKEVYDIDTMGVTRTEIGQMWDFCKRYREPLDMGTVPDNGEWNDGIPDVLEPLISLYHEILEEAEDAKDIHFVSCDREWSGTEKYPFEVEKVLMIKDGVRYFVKEVIVNSPNCPGYVVKAREDIMRIKHQLLETNGMYYSSYDSMGNPLVMIQKAIDMEYTLDNSRFENHENEIDACGYQDFGGYFKEVSHGFRYRIYDKELAEQVVKLGASLKRSK
jgi:hypothetical protein